MALGCPHAGEATGAVVGFARLASRGTVPGGLGSVTAGQLPSPEPTFELKRWVAPCEH